MDDIPGIVQQITYHINNEIFYCKKNAETYRKVLTVFRNFCGEDRLTVQDVMRNPRELLKLLQEYVDAECKPYEFANDKFAPSESFRNHKELYAELYSLLEKQQKIEAIKLLRNHYPDCRLKDAKDAIETWYCGSDT
jgi:sulfite reductase alpha subunit-like flavoprotein